MIEVLIFDDDDDDRPFSVIGSVTSFSVKVRRVEEASLLRYDNVNGGYGIIPRGTSCSSTFGNIDVSTLITMIIMMMMLLMKVKVIVNMWREGGWFVHLDGFVDVEGEGRRRS